MSTYAKCPNGHDVELSDMPEEAAEPSSEEDSQGQHWESVAPVVCAECGTSFVPCYLFLKAS
jgi:hypothetical protein